jgi:hypothetical protein
MPDTDDPHPVLIELDAEPCRNTRALEGPNMVPNRVLGCQAIAILLRIPGVIESATRKNRNCFKACRH